MSIYIYESSCSYTVVACISSELTRGSVGGVGVEEKLSGRIYAKMLCETRYLHRLGLTLVLSESMECVSFLLFSFDASTI